MSGGKRKRTSPAGGDVLRDGRMEPGGAPVRDYPAWAALNFCIKRDLRRAALLG